ncbi:hypothetical protein FQR65_LT17265 [Abscondita terminalis]|nr:hypothetical protein FQR65_LT17265 [Abscondita terminalis]
MKIPTRPAPSIDEAFRNNTIREQTRAIKKKPPPRPPPPNFEKNKSKSVWNLNQQFDGFSLIDLSPPESPNNFVTHHNRNFGGSISSSFSSSTSSLASSKKSFECDNVNLDPWPIAAPSSVAPQSVFYINSNNAPMVPQISVPTIIRPQNNRKTNYNSLYETCQREQSPPMPMVPPPSPPKEVAEVVVPYGIAIFDYPQAQPDDLALQVDDVVFLLRRLNFEWYYGRVEDREGMFPVAFISVQVPLTEDDRMVTAVYEFKAQEPGDLTLKPGQIVHVTSRVSKDWLMGESEGKVGQFPTCFVDRIPSTL